MVNNLRAWVIMWVLMFNVSAIAADGLESSVVTIYTKTGRQGSGQGTGFVIGPQGLIATAYHVIQGATDIEVFSDSGQRTTEITLVAADPAHDLALIRAERLRGVRPLELSSEMVNYSNRVRVVGSPRGLPSQIMFGRPTSPSGIVSSLQVSSDNGRPVFANQIDIVPLDVTIYNGMSGAPVVSGNDRVVGVLSGSYSEGGGIGWAIPTKYLIALTRREPEGRTVDSVQVWPPLELMRASWVSPKRSYDVPLSPKHIRKLEILENAMRTIQGSWKGQETKRRVIWDSPQYLGRCYSDEKEQLTFNFLEIDIAAAEIRGYASIRLTSSATYVEPNSIAGIEDGCYQTLHADPALKSASRVLSGDLFLKGPSTQSSRNMKLRGTLNVTDCNGSFCTAEMYGATSLGSLEMVSDDVIKMVSDNIIKFAFDDVINFGSVILRKQ